MRLLDLISRQKVTVEVGGDVIVVKMPGTRFSITYEKTEENRLVASSFHAPKSFHTKRAKSPFQSFSASRGPRRMRRRGSWAGSKTKADLNGRVESHLDRDHLT